MEKASQTEFLSRVRMPAFPAALWNKKNLVTVAKAVGTPVWIYEVTMEIRFLRYMRVKVLVDFSKPLRLEPYNSGKRSFSHNSFFH